MVSNGLDLDGRTLTLEQVEAVARGRVVVTLEKIARERMEASRRVIAEAIASGKPVYGVTTGFGRLADTVVPPDEQKRLQLNLLRSHAVGVGPPLADDAAQPLKNACGLLRRVLLLPFIEDLRTLPQ